MKSAAIPYAVYAHTIMKLVKLQKSIIDGVGYDLNKNHIEHYYMHIFLDIFKGIKYGIKNDESRKVFLFDVF